MAYNNQVQRAIDYIEANLQSELTMESVAKAAASSLWHFQRIFCSVLGETVADYIRKRRLTSAMKDLSETQTRILDIAIAYGFESQASFSRSFKALYGMTPGQCRRDKTGSCLPLTKPRITAEYIEHLNKGVNMEPKIIDCPETTVVGMGTPFISIRSPERNNHVVLPALWKSFLQRQDEIKSRVSWKSLGLCECLPQSERKHPDEMFYMVCTEVTDVNEVPLGMISKVIPAGRYAVFTHIGPLDGLGHTMHYIFGTWASRSGYELREAPDLEVYDERFKLGQPDSEVDLYIPIK